MNHTMNEVQGLAEVSEALGIASRVYEHGWIREHTSNPQLASFGEEIQQLADNLNYIVRVVENARICYQQHAIRSPMFRGFFVQRDWNLSSLHDITGPFKNTIAEGEALLAQNRDGYRNDASAYNDEWLLVMKPKVDEICGRLRMHNAKLKLLLKPLETKLLGDVQHEFASQAQPQHMGQSLPAASIQGLFVLNVEQTLVEYAQPKHIRFDVSPELDTQLRTQLEESKPELRYPGTLRLQSGIEMFAEYYNQSTKSFVPGHLVSERQPSAQQYINLVRTYHVLQAIQQSQELRQVDRASLWPLFIAELMSAIKTESQKFSSRSQDRLLPPDMNSLKRALRGTREGVSSREDVSKLMSPHFETYSKPIYSVPLPAPQNGIQRQLSISRVDSTKLRLVEAIHEQNNATVPMGEIVMDIDLATIQLSPIYATPSSRPRPLEVLLQTQLGQLNPSFCEIKHIYRLQHLLTGYRVYDKYDQAMVKVSFFVSGKSSPLEEHGRVQLWLPQPFNTADRTAVTASRSSVDAAASISQDPPALVQPQSPTPSVGRTSSFRNLFSRSRRSSNTQSPTPTTPSASSLVQMPAVPPSQASPPPIPFQAQASLGPFELPAVNQPSGTQGYSSYTLPMRTQGQDNGGRGNGVGRGQQASAALPQLNIYRPHRSDDMPEVAQVPPPLYSTTAREQQTRAHVHRGGAPAAQQSYPYSPDSFSPVTPPAWAAEQNVNNAPQHQRTPSSSAPSISSEHFRAASTIRPTGMNAQSSPSVVSTRSTRSHSSMASTVSTIRTSTGTSSVSSSGLARMHHKPQKPLLVIFLKSREPSAKLSIVAIQIDSHTSIVRERCDCYNSHSTCRITCVERSSGNGLLAQRWEADSGLTSFNVAKLGEFQRKDNQNIWPNLKRVSLRFEKMEDRYRFAGSPCACTVQTTHELSRCNLQSHNGVYGIVKQIGDQMLQNYHNERNSAMKRPMVLAPLAEGDLIS